MFGILLHVVPKTDEYLRSSIDDLVITHDETINAIAKPYHNNNNNNKTVPTKTVTIKIASTSFYIFLTFSLITIALLIAVNKTIYYHITSQITNFKNCILII